MKQEDRTPQEGTAAAAAAAATGTSHSPKGSPVINRSNNSAQQATPTKVPGSPSTGTTVVPTSRTALEIQNISRAREERRAMQAEVRKMRQGLDTPEQDILAYCQMIDRFRDGLRVAGGPADTGKSQPTDDSVIRVCVRKRPLNSRG